ncbi:hypothetical protein Sste5344_007919 [Sporothrix stenoceras]
MASEASGLLGSWLVKLLQSVFFPQSPYVAVRIIAVCLVVFDVCLWVWRLYSVNRNAYLRRQQQEQHQQRLLREQRRVLRKQQQQQQQQQQQSKPRNAAGEATTTSVSR